MRHKLTELLDSEAFKEVRKKISDIVGSNFNLSKLNVAIRESEQPEEVIMALAAVLSLVRQNNRKCWNDLFRRYVKTYSSVLVKHFFLEETDEKEEKLVVKDTLLFLQLISVLIHTNIFPEMTYAQITHLLNQQFVLQYSPHTVMRLLKENPVEMEELETYLRKVRADFRKRDLSKTGLPTHLFTNLYFLFTRLFQSRKIGLK